MKEITLCLTSCNRWNLLERTIDSFLKLNKYSKRYVPLRSSSPNKV